ncbi:MAG: ATP-dependent metallopeptidase FtsH/Yme1/Tma family protein [bacterium]|nr:ATP-dependent metallopeptidase FtsH/Yme1/Tma family protein [bacterium]
MAMFVLLAIFSMFGGNPRESSEVDYTEFLARLETGDIGEFTIQGERVEGVFSDGRDFRTLGPAEHPGLAELAKEHQVTVKYRSTDEGGLWNSVLISWLPMILFIGLWFFLFRQLQSGGGKAMSFGKSRARLLNENQTRVTFADVAGIEEAKAELEEIVEFLRDPKKFTRLGGRIPKGVLLVGPPGTGKTLLARAIAGEAGVPFFSISGSDFVEMFVGVGASRVRDLFAQGKKNAPCIVFIDEIDAVGRHRGAGLGGGHDEREQTLNQMLVEMDGFEANEGVIIIAATNRPDVLDPAMLRPGRFDRHVTVHKPDLRGREAILRVHSRRVLLGSDVDLAVIARGTPGFSGADLENLCNEAALLAARRDAESVCMRDFELAKDKLLMGGERRSMILSEKERRVTAFHEAGHALVAMLEESTDPLHKVTIIPRGGALGVTMTLPVEDRYCMTKQELLANISYGMGGRAAEELVFDQLSTGAANDLEQATKTARAMVCTYGMSDKLGPISLSDDSGNVFLGIDMKSEPKFSSDRGRVIDEEVSSILNDRYERACSLLNSKRAALEAIAHALLERETLGIEELELLVDGQELPALVVPVADSKPVSAPESGSAENNDQAGDRFPKDPIPDPEPIPG